jgi:putative PIN family toxin of toxin-antitoxin system
MVFLQAAVSRAGPAYALVAQVETGRIDLLLSQDVVDEVREVLLRPAVQKKFPLLTIRFVDEFLHRMGSLAVFIEHVPPTFRSTRDPDDEIYVNLALAGQARYLVTRDRDLLDLEIENNPEGRDLRRLNAGFRILDPVELLRQLFAAHRP